MTTTQIPAAALAFADEEFPTPVKAATVNPYTDAVAPYVASRKGFALTVPAKADSDAVKAIVSLLRKAVSGHGAVSLKVKATDTGTAKTPATKLNLIVVDKITRERKAKDATPTA